MNKLFYMPYKTGGVVKGTLDIFVKAVAAVTWLLIMRALAAFLYTAIFIEYNPKVRLWWFSYCLLMFIGASFFAYTAICSTKKY